MFKTIVTQLAKSVWDNAGTAPAPAQAGAEHVSNDSGTSSQPADQVDLEALGIELPYHPKVGTACGDACRCSWDITIRWSDEHQCNATFATWQTANDESVCPDCDRRRQEWQNELVRLEER